MWQYNLFIGSIVFLLIADQFTTKKRLGFFGIIAIFITITFVVCRDYVGYDYANYVQFFSYSVDKLIERRLEWGFIGTTAIIRLFTDNYFWLFFVVGLSTIVLVSHGISLYTANFRIAFLIYLLTPGLFLNSFSIIRQGLAIALLFNAYYYLYTKELKLFYLYTIAAVCFHYSVLAALPFILFSLKFRDYAKTFIIIGIPISLILSKFQIIPQIIGLILGDTRFIAYANFTDTGTSFTKLLILNTIILFYLFFANRLNSLNKSL